jgi:alginate O-acetyltransferase complex protein AlgI
MVVADNLAVQTQAMSYPQFEHIASSKLFALIVAYSCQIFADFFGYSLIAMGLAALFGYRLPVNFNRPYIATSFLDFWRRWHMSLSAWLRDYLYIPLGGSRHGRLRTYINLFIVMFLGGLWHGAAWSFAIWGTLHGLALALERPFLQSRFYLSDSALVKLMRMALVFAIVSLAWVFFKLQDYTQALGYLQAIFRNTDKGLQPQELGVIYVYCLPVFVYHALPLLRDRGIELQRQAWPYVIMLFLLLTNSGIPGAFIYFQF